jgi:hypothetical protein
VRKGGQDNTRHHLQQQQHSSSSSRNPEQGHEDQLAQQAHTIDELAVLLSCGDPLVSQALDTAAQRLALLATWLANMHIQLVCLCARNMSYQGQLCM